MSTLEFVVFLFALFGALLTLLAAVGVLRMPDYLCRLQTSSKAATLGSICAVLGVALLFQERDIVIRALMISIFFSITAPIAAHIIGRAGYLSKVPLSKETCVDDLKGRYQSRTHQLKSWSESL